MTSNLEKLPAETCLILGFASLLWLPTSKAEMKHQTEKSYLGYTKTLSRDVMQCSCCTATFIGFGTLALRPAKTYTLRRSLWTYAIKIRSVTDNYTVKKGLRKGNRGHVRESLSVLSFFVSFVLSFSLKLPLCLSFSRSFSTSLSLSLSVSLSLSISLSVSLSVSLSLTPKMSHFLTRRVRI